MLKFFRESLKRRFFNLLSKVINHQQGRDVLDEALGNRIRSVASASQSIKPDLLPYRDLGQAHEICPTRLRNDPIFITGRFRSGSTLLWNVFRNIESCTAYYEPLNERQWFDPETRGERLDSSHVNVGRDYWREYDGLKKFIGPYYQEHWIDRDLYMDQQSSDWNLQKYIERLIESAQGRPVLQFNRIDFRLPWLCHIFPNAKFVHIYRHPRDQWVSTLMDPSSYPPLTGALHDFTESDRFYLKHWVRDLQHWFPFLRNWRLHPYCHYYFLWRLSYLFGVHYCDESMQFEMLINNPRHQLGSILTRLGIDGVNWEIIENLIQSPERGKWKNYASGDWFRDKELLCEFELATYFGWSLSK